MPWRDISQTDPVERVVAVKDPLAVDFKPPIDIPPHRGQANAAAPSVFQRDPLAQPAVALPLAIQWRIKLFERKTMLLHELLLWK
jgi:hypothetical protein